MSPRTRTRHYSPFWIPRLSMSELVMTTLDHESTDMLIDKWLEHRGSSHDAYHEWFMDVRERKHAVSQQKQIIAWTKGDFVPENIFCRTVDTGRLIPLDRTWTTHVYHHSSMSDRKRSMMPVVFTMLPELMLLRGMHDTGCDEIYVIVTDLKRQEMDDVTEYFKMVCRHAYGRTCKPSMEQRIQFEHMRLCHTLVRRRRNPCFPQIDLTFRALLYEKRPRFLVLFSHQTTSYSQIFFTHPNFVPDEEIFFDYPTGCPNPCCTEDCEMIRFPRRGVATAAVLNVKRGGKYGRRVRARQMCNWIDCDVCFWEETLPSASSSCESSCIGSTTSSGSSEDDGPEPIASTAPDDPGRGTTSSPAASALVPNRPVGQLCSKCRLVRYCSRDHQKLDWPEHSRVCTKFPTSTLS